MTKGLRIRQARLNKSLTLDELAVMCGTTKQTIFKYENNIITNIPTDKIEALASALGVSEAFIMGWSESSSPTLSDSEQFVVDSMRGFNQEGQQKVVDYVTDLNESGRYKKFSSSEIA